MGIPTPACRWSAPAPGGPWLKGTNPLPALRREFNVECVVLTPDVALRNEALRVGLVRKRGRGHVDTVGADQRLEGVGAVLADRRCSRDCRAPIAVRGFERDRPRADKLALELDGP